MSEEERRSSMRHAGAIEFMAPEQNEGKMLLQTDVYSYGVILFELLTGTVPFPLSDNGETARNTVMVSHMEAAIPDILELRQKNLPDGWSAKQKAQEMNVPQWMLNLVYKCLEKTPENRYANGMELHDAITEHSIANIKLDDSPKTSYQITPTESSAYTNPVVEYQAEQDSDVKLSKPVFALLILLLVSFMGYSAYLQFKKPEVINESIAMPAIDTATKSDNTPAVEQPDNSYRDKKRISDSIVQSTIKSELEKAKKENPYEPDTTLVDTADSEEGN
jgi:serine/threonine protein kinase